MKLQEDNDDLMADDDDFSSNVDNSGQWLMSWNSHGDDKENEKNDHEKDVRV